jgi:preprotein translocase SecE subunit
MARDRKKAKARRAKQERQQRSGGSGRGGASRESRERPLDPERRPTTDPPEPTEEISADAELAKEAEMGLPVDEVDSPVDGDDRDDRDDKAVIYEDELSDDAAGHGVLNELVDRDEDLGIDEEDVDPELERQAEEAAKATGRPRRDPKASKPEGNRVFAFLKACWAELQRVQWPDRRHVGQATAVVLGFVIIAGTFLGVSDFVWQKAISALLDL